MELNIYDHAKIARRLKKYNPAVDPSTVRFFWDIFRNPDICAAFYIPNRIHLRSEWRDITVNESGLDDVICHELYHCGQFRRQGFIIYALANLTRINEIAAYREEERVFKLMGSGHTHAR